MHEHLPLRQSLHPRRRARVGRLKVEAVEVEGPGVNHLEGEELRLASHSRKLSLRAERVFEKPRVGGRLALYSQHWRSHSWAYDVIHEGLRWEWSAPPRPYSQFNQDPTPVLVSFAETLLESQVIERTNTLSFQGSLFSVPKKGTDKRRVILDLSTLNLNIRCPRFKMTTVEQVRQVLPQGS